MVQAIANHKVETLRQVQAALTELAETYKKLYKISKATSRVNIQNIQQLANAINAIGLKVPQFRELIINELRMTISRYMPYRGRGGYR